MYIIAEIGVNHDGRLDKAIKLIDAALETGCDAVKFQSFRAKDLVHPSALKVDYQLRSNKNKESHYEMIERLEFNGNKFIKALNYSKKLGIDFITTPYDPCIAAEVYQLGVRKFKTASADLNDIYIHSTLAKLKNIEIFIATGMSNLEQINNTLKIYSNNKPNILHCVSGYPCEDRSINLRCIKTIENAFPNYSIGYSDHSVGFTSALIAASFGCSIFERHFTLDKLDNGPDHYASSDVKEMSEYVKQLRRVENILGSSNKNLQQEEIGMSLRSKKAIIAKKNIKIGEKISLQNTYALRPAEKGVAVDDINLLLGKHSLVDINKGEFIHLGDIS